MKSFNYLIFVFFVLFVYMCQTDDDDSSNITDNSLLSITASAISSNSITLSWDNVAGATNYALYCRVSNASSIIYSGVSTSYTHTGLYPSTTYYYMVYAYMSDGSSIHGDEVAISTLSTNIQIGDYEIVGFISNASSDSFTKYSQYDGNVVLIFPSVSEVVADSYITMQLSNISSTYENIAITITNTSKEEKRIWITITNKGYITKDIYLRYGAGRYKIGVLVGPDSNGYYYYAAVFYITNVNTNDLRYLLPSDYIQSLNSDIYSKAVSLTAGISEVSNKVKALHDWVVTNLYYDFDSLNTGQRKSMDALSVFERGSGVCEGYANLLAAFTRALGIPTKYVVGDIKSSTGWENDTNAHAWNEIYWGGKWHIVDPTWDDPIVNGTSDYPDGSNLRYTYFDISYEDFTNDHRDWWIDTRRMPYLNLP